MASPLCNDKGEKVDIYLDMKAGRVVMDRTQSGITTSPLMAK